MANARVRATWLGQGNRILSSKQFEQVLEVPSGGEAFGLHAIGQGALRQHNATLVALADVVRGGPQEVMFGVGLLLIAVSAIMVAIAIWRSGVLPRWSGVPFALAFALYIPQFFGNQPIRVAHGLLVAIGCLWIAASMWRKSNARTLSR